MGIEHRGSHFMFDDFISGHLKEIGFAAIAGCETEFGVPGMLYVGIPRCFCRYDAGFEDEIDTTTHRGNDNIMELVEIAALRSKHVAFADLVVTIMLPIGVVPILHVITDHHVSLRGGVNVIGIPFEQLALEAD
jgi:hypothetical protein